MPKTHPLPWTAEEDGLLYNYYFTAKGSFARIREMLLAEGFERTERAIEVRYAQLKARVKRPIRQPSEMEMRALHRPWTWRP
jgi:hypothetical protein